MTSTQEERDAWRHMPCNTAEELELVIEAFCDAWDRTSVERFSATCGFGHIAISDYNLEDGNIQWCIAQADVWFNEKLADWTTDGVPDLGFDPNGKEAWERWGYDELCAIRDAVRGFLEFLLTVPAHIRESL